MADAPLPGRWGYWGLFAGLSALVLFYKLLPLDPGPGRIPGPDVLICLAFAWVVRRPALVPMFLAAAVLLTADLLLMRPPGLWTALAVLGLEYLCGRSGPLRDGTFLTEWLTVAAVISAMFTANALILGLFLVDQPGLGLTLIRLLATIAVYPLVVVLAARTFGIAKEAPREANLRGATR
jgi:rod shape-determining protein MreD